MNGAIRAHVEIELSGKVYPCPFSDRFRRHSREEYETILASVHEYGIQTAVRLYDDTDLGLTDCVLDGQGRLSALAELGGGLFPKHHHGDLTTERAYTLAKILNDARRHERDREAIERRRQERAERLVVVAAAKAEGQTVREIAVVVGVSPTTVQADVEKGRDLGLIPPPVAPPPRYPELAPADDEGDDAEEEGEVDDPSEVDEPDTSLAVDGGTEFPYPPFEVRDQSAGPHRDSADPEWINPALPPHPFQTILNKMQHLATIIMQAIAKDDEYGRRLDKFLLYLQTGKIPMPRILLPRAVVTDGPNGVKYLRNQFIGLQGLRRVVRLAGMGSDSKAKTVITKFLEPPEER